MDDIEAVKKMVYMGSIEIDDPIDSGAKHTLLHDAVIMDRVELFDFLLAQGANLMVRDMNGYTPLLKAAALGRYEMVRKMIEHGVDPRHTDPYGNTARDKAVLYSRYELQRYLHQMEDQANKGELKLVNWKDPERLHRSGRYITRFDY